MSSASQLNVNRSTGRQRSRRPLAWTAPLGPTPSNSEDFAVWVQPHIPFLVRLAKRRMKSADLAWDAVQDSLLTLWRTGARPDPLRPWLAQTLIHRCLHLQRSMRRRRHYEELAILLQTIQGNHVTGDAFSELERQHLGRFLAQALAQLPADQRAILHLREVERLDYEQIAAQLNISSGTVRSRLHRARQSARYKLNRALDRENCALCQATTDNGQEVPEK